MVALAMTQTLSPPLTLPQFLQLPETKPAQEYSNGKISQKPMPPGKHSVLQTELVIFLNAALKTPKIARAFSELRFTFGGHSIVPDVAVMEWANIPRDPQGQMANRFNLPPDWAIEILSPDQSSTPVTKNILHSLNHGTSLGWLIDPAEETVFVYQPNHSPQAFDRPEQRLPTPNFAPNISLTIEQLWSWLWE
jgi:Uma2 family endonuclease